MSETLKSNSLNGGEFLIKESQFENTYIPSDFTEEHRMMMQMAEDFLAAEVTPNLDRIDKMEEGLMVSILNKSGELGLLGINVPEQYGGFGKDFNTGMLMTEVLGAGHSFAVAMAAHTGIGTLPILYFGNDAQKEKYLPKLATGEWKACYCLTEPGSGSDALAAKTKAVLTDDGKHYVLNGQKMWITNGGFADVFIVFAKIDGEKFTGFIVEKSYEGLSLNEEEAKMGIKGSSTRQVFLSDVKVPVENVLGEIGKGHLIAFNILNIGRAKLAAAALGGAKVACTHSISYANEREQFNTPIAKFGAIKHKLAEQAIRIYALESALYRSSNLINEKEKELASDGLPFSEALLGAAEEYAVECAILKVFGSEVLDYVVDEGVQVYGGYGFSADYPMDRAYRDSRINRIFEGTNEINRLLIMDMLLKRALKGKIDLMTPAKNIQQELMGIPDMSNGHDELFSREEKAIINMKKAVLMAAGATVQKFMQDLQHEQEILMNLSDMIIEAFVSESVLLRTQKLISVKGEEASSVQIDKTKVFISDSMDRIAQSARNAISSWAEGDEARLLLLGVKRFTKLQPFNCKDARRRIADKLSEAGAYTG